MGTLDTASAGDVGEEGQCSQPSAATASPAPSSLPSAFFPKFYSTNLNQVATSIRQDELRASPPPPPPPPPLLSPPPLLDTQPPSPQACLPAPHSPPHSPPHSNPLQPFSVRQRIPQAMVVVAQAVVPHDYGSNSNSGNAATTVPTSITNAAQLPEFLQRLLPEHCPTATAAKRAIRRRLILRIPGFATHGSVASANDGMSGIPPHPAGVVATMTDAVTPGEVLQLLARRGTGIMGWVGVGAMRPAAAAAAADAAARGNTEINTNMTSAAVVAAPARAACTGAVIIEGDDQTGRGTGISWLQGLPVAYEDEHMAVVIKPPGIETQGPGGGCRAPNSEPHSARQPKTRCVEKPPIPQPPIKV
ncbi:hypothetical protein Vretifemale_13489, partial [Volvox reticuliferus]